MKKQPAFMSPERLIAFSDGVIAIAITLLVLNLELPENYASMGFTEVFRECLTKFDSWLISFWIIGGFWISHHKLFSKVKQVDMTILWLNLFFLLIITSISWMVSLIEAYPDEPRAVVVFSSGLGLAGIIHFWMHSHVQLRRYFHDAVPTHRRTFAMLATPFTAICSIGCAYIISPSMGLNLWLLRHVIFIGGNAIDNRWKMK